MIDKLDFLLRYWELNARNSSMGAPLEASEQIELLSLMQLVTVEQAPPPARNFARPKDALPAQLIGDGAIRKVEIRHVGAGALVVSAASAVPEGAHFLLRVADALTGLEVVLPCRVAWVHRGAPVILALVVDGIPKRTVFAGVPEPAITMPLVLGKQVRSVA